MKRCCRCGQDLPLRDFYNRADRKDGKQSRCKACHKASIPPRKDNYPDKLRLHPHHRVRAKRSDARVEKTCFICGAQITRQARMCRPCWDSRGHIVELGPNRQMVTGRGFPDSALGSVRHFGSGAA